MENSQEKIKWTREFAAGGVVYKIGNGSASASSKAANASADRQLFVLLVHPKGPNFGPPAGYWTFPKGLLDVEGENTEQVAVREVREEGGVNAQIIKPLGTFKFFKNSQKVLKLIDFYLMEYVSGDPKDHDEEMADAMFVEIEKVESMLKYPHDKEVLQKAKQSLSQSLF